MVGLSNFAFFRKENLFVADVQSMEVLVVGAPSNNHASQSTGIKGRQWGMNGQRLQGN